MNILFVCTGNICRSPMAEGYLKNICSEKHKNVCVQSAGTSTYCGEPPSEHAVRVLSDSGIDISNHKSQNLRRELLDWADKIIVMCGSHRDAIQRRFEPTKISGKIFLLNEFGGNSEDIPDPYGRDIECYRRCFNEIKKAVDKLSESID